MELIPTSINKAAIIDSENLCKSIDAHILNTRKRLLSATFIHYFNRYPYAILFLHGEQRKNYDGSTASIVSMVDPKYVQERAKILLIEMNDSSYFSKGKDPRHDLEYSEDPLIFKANPDCKKIHYKKTSPAYLVDMTYIYSLNLNILQTYPCLLLIGINLVHTKTTIQQTMVWCIQKKTCQKLYPFLNATIMQ